MQNLRRISQGLFLLFFLFLFLQTETKGNDELGYPVRLFLDFDPLILLTTLFSAHAVAKAFFYSLFVILLTIVLGRVFCGWVCPLGTLHNIAGMLNRRKPKQTPARGEEKSRHRIKYYILIGIIASSIFTLQPVGIMDPLSLLIRSLSVGIFPWFNYAVRSTFDAIYSANPAGITAITEPVYSLLKKTVLSFEQAHFRQSFLIGTIFLGILGLNLIEKRFWCRYLCSLGALLGLLSRFSLLKRSVSEGCTECGACGRVCQGNAQPDVKGQWKDAECYYCWNCDDVCPNNAVSFGFSGKKITPAMDLGRRRVITSALTGIATVPLIRITPLGTANAKDPALLRPPGALEEKEFLARCVKCGECMKVCTTNGLQPTLFEAGLEGIWSPVLVPRIGYCEYRCTLCGQVCPTGAIKRLSLEEKAKVRIGLAMIDRSRCLPWAHGRPCIVCEEVCPTSKKAIWLDEAKVRDRNGRVVTVLQPRVDLELCIGCGICEAKCPVLGKPAITVTNLGESRSKENQLLL
ncbi:MAG: 4Fe-4S binding protein [Nitrospiraceae bacterium]|nr:4Fe-4S binding protein [Nitrospiraceae bacterium]